MNSIRRHLSIFSILSTLAAPAIALETFYVQATPENRLRFSETSIDCNILALSKSNKTEEDLIVLVRRKQDTECSTDTSSVGNIGGAPIPKAEPPGSRQQFAIGSTKVLSVPDAFIGLSVVSLTTVDEVSLMLLSEYRKADQAYNNPISIVPANPNLSPYTLLAATPKQPEECDPEDWECFIAPASACDRVSQESKNAGGNETAPVTENPTIRQLVIDAIPYQMTMPKADAISIASLAKLDDCRFMLGINIFTQDQESSTVSLHFITGAYFYRNGKIFLNSAKRLSTSADLAPILVRMTGGEPELSAMTYNTADRKLYFATSYRVTKERTRKRFSSLLWALPVSPEGVLDFNSIALAKLTDNSTAGYTSKVVDLAFVRPDTALVLSEDERLNQASSSETISTNSAKPALKRIISGFQFAKYPKLVF